MTSFLLLLLVASVAMAALSGVDHARSPERLAAVLAEQDVLPPLGQRVVVRALGPVELALAAVGATTAGVVQLGSADWVPLGGCSLAALYLAVGLYSWVALRQGYTGDCGCGLGATELSELVVLRALAVGSVLLVASLVAAQSALTPLSLSLGVSAYLLGAALAVLLVALPVAFPTSHEMKPGFAEVGP